MRQAARAPTEEHLAPSARDAQRRGSVPGEGSVRRALQTGSTVLPCDYEHTRAEPLSTGFPAEWSGWSLESGSRRCLAPLFRREWTRAIICEALSTTMRDGPIDVARSLDLLVRLEAFLEVPRIGTRTLAWGCQLLLDVGSGMKPFAGDRQQLVRIIQEFVGLERVQLLSFREAPYLRVEDAAGNACSYRPPQGATPVCIVTDFGIGQPPYSITEASIELWTKFVRSVQGAGRRLIAFVPYPPKRWPESLAAECALVQWDRASTVSHVRDAVMGSAR
jgi:hypothetical protein